jgi:GT2 family glycosyltransferase
MALPRVGIVVPTLGLRPDLLKLNLESLATQSERPYIVVVCPTSAHQELEDEYGEVADVIVTDPGQGLSAAINVGMKAMHSDVVYANWLGDDDQLTPDSLATSCELMDTHPDCVLVYGNCSYVSASQREFWINKPGRLAVKSAGLGANLVPQPGALFRLNAFKLVGGVNENLKYAMDLELWLKLNRVGSTRYVDHVLAIYAWHAGSLSAANQLDAFNESALVRRRNSKGLSLIPVFAYNFVAKAWISRAKNKLDIKGAEN